MQDTELPLNSDQWPPYPKPFNWFVEVAEPKIEEICNNLRTICNEYRLFERDDTARRVLARIEDMLTSRYGVYHQKVEIASFKDVTDPLVLGLLGRHRSMQSFARGFQGFARIQLPRDLKHWERQSFNIIHELNSQIEPPSFNRIASMHMGAQANKQIFTRDGKSMTIIDQSIIPDLRGVYADF